MEGTQCGGIIRPKEPKGAWVSGAIACMEIGMDFRNALNRKRMPTQKSHSEPIYALDRHPIRHYKSV
jgi:hypothetical protein